MLGIPDYSVMFYASQFDSNFWKAYKTKFSAIIVALVSCLLVLLLALPVIAQNENLSLDRLQIFSIDSPIVQTKAEVVVDEQNLFQIGSSQQLSANERAKVINAELQLAIKSPQNPNIEIKQRNKSPVIYINDRYLLTVTPEDVDEGNTPEQQANIWKTELANTLDRARLARNPRHIREKSILAIIILVVVIASDKVLSLLKEYSLGQAIAKLLPGINPANLESPNFGVLFKTKLIFARVILWLGTFYWLTGIFPQSRHWRTKIINLLGESFKTSLLTLGDRSYSLSDLLILGGLFWGLFIASQTFTNLLRTRVLNQTRMSRGSQEVIFIIVKYGLISFGTIILLQVWGLNLSSIAILGSAFGVGIGFGFQDIAKNFASGVVLLFERSVQIGDFIEVNGHQGTVEKIQARSIVLKTLNRVSIVVPNSRLLADEVINWSHDSATSRFALPVGVAYGCDSEAVEEILLQVAKEHPEVLKYPLPQVLFKGFGDSSLDFELMIWLADPSRHPLVTSQLYFRLEKVLRNRHIEIPFPQRDLHLRGNVPLGVSPDLESALLHWLNKSASNSPTEPPANP